MPTIFAIDDDRAILDLLSKRLGTAGYQVEGCNDGRQALAKLQRSNFDLLILDLLLPGVSGFNLLDQLATHPTLHKIPVIVISGVYRGLSHRDQVTGHKQVVDYYEKPINFDELLKALAKHAGPAEPAAAPSTEAPTPPPSLLEPNKPATPSTSTFDLYQEPAQDSETESAATDAAEPAGAQEQATEDWVGTFEDKSVVEILGQLWQEGATGSLMLRREQVKKVVLVQDGAIVSVRSNQVSECLGQVLASERLITQDELNESLRQMKEKNEPQGAILVGMGSITKGNLKYALELQLETKVFDLFSWRSGDFRFKPSTEESNASPPWNWPAASVIAEGIRRHIKPPELENLLAPFMNQSFAYKDPEAEAAATGAFTDQDRQIVAKLSFPNTPHDLVSDKSKHSAETKLLLYTLISLGLIQGSPNQMSQGKPDPKHEPPRIS